METTNKNWSEPHKAGVDAGRRWAMMDATYHELAVLAGFFDPNGAGFFDPNGGLNSADIGEYLSTISVPDYVGNHSHIDNFRYGFVDGAIRIFRDVHPTARCG